MHLMKKRPRLKLHEVQNVIIDRYIKDGIISEEKRADALNILKYETRDLKARKMETNKFIVLFALFFSLALMLFMSIAGAFYGYEDAAYFVGESVIVATAALAVYTWRAKHDYVFRNLSTYGPEIQKRVLRNMRESCKDVINDGMDGDGIDDGIG